MKIAIPTNDKKTVADHFGRCQSYLCFDENGQELDGIKNTSEHMGGQGLPPELLKRHSVEVLLCKDLGPYAIELCKKNDIKVFKDPSASGAIELFRNWRKGELEETGLGQGCESHK